MARATRSSANNDSQPTPLPQQPKKRKRNVSQSESQPKKVLRTDTAIKEISSEIGDSSHSTVAGHQITLDPVLSLEDAQNILEVLEITDKQALLDRIFPLTPVSSNNSQVSLSLRTLLKSPADYPLNILKSAIRNLFPISSHPRSRPSSTAIQQLRFCNLALSLLEQASRNSLPLQLNIESVLSTISNDPNDSNAQLCPPEPARRKYALMQHLPNGDYWTSLNLDIQHDDSGSSSQPQDLRTGNAELVAILPSSSSSHAAPTLGSYHTKPLGPKKVLPSQRRVTTGAFLDYGVWASFAPTFDQDGEVVGQRELSEVIFYNQERRKETENAQREKLEGRGNIIDISQEPETDADVAMVDLNIGNPAATESSKRDVHAELEELLPPEEVKLIKSALGSLELEKAVQELLEHNRRALDRLAELQTQRLHAEVGGNSIVEEGSEEWDTAQSILESLSILFSLRPQSFATPSLIPPTSVIRRLHRTLALEPSTGWHGTLPSTHAIALRDDSTVKVKTGGTAPIAASSVGTAPAASSAVTPTPSAPAYAAYTYTYSANSQQTQPIYRPQSSMATSYASYKPGQVAPYYQGYLAPATQQQQAYYNQQSYAAATTGQQPYAAYSNWYSQFSNAPSGAASGRGTPQPVVATPATYGSFFNATTTSTPGSAAKTPAVANTVTGSKAGGANAVQPPITNWATGYASTQGGVGTLPAHLRSTQPAQQTAYYGQYQQQTPTPTAR